MTRTQKAKMGRPTRFREDMRKILLHMDLVSWSGVNPSQKSDSNPYPNGLLLSLRIDVPSDAS